MTFEPASPGRELVLCPDPTQNGERIWSFYTFLGTHYFPVWDYQSELEKQAWVASLSTLGWLFERLMHAYGIEERRWALKLAPQLTGKAQQAYAAMCQEEALQYPEIKKAIFQGYDISISSALSVSNSRRQ